MDPAWLDEQGNYDKNWWKKDKPDPDLAGLRVSSHPTILNSYTKEELAGPEPEIRLDSEWEMEIEKPLNNDLHFERVDHADKSPEMIALMKKRFQLGPDFKIVGRIGKGSMGDVCWAKHVPSGNIDVAVKKMENIWFEVEETRRVARELNLLRAMAGHPNMVKLLDVRLPEGVDVQGLARDADCFWEEGFFDTVYLVFEFVPTDASKLFHSDLHLREL